MIAIKIHTARKMQENVLQTRLGRVEPLADRHEGAALLMCAYDAEALQKGGLCLNFRKSLSFGTNKHSKCPTQVSRPFNNAAPMVYQGHIFTQESPNEIQHRALDRSLLATSTSTCRRARWLSAGHSRRPAGSSDAGNNRPC